MAYAPPSGPPPRGEADYSYPQTSIAHPEYPAGVQPPNLPERPVPHPEYPAGVQAQFQQGLLTSPAQGNQFNGYNAPPPPQRQQPVYDPMDDPSDQTHYMRDPKKLVGYLIPFPEPKLLPNPAISPGMLPTRFMIYTPPPPPLKKPAEGEKEAKLHKVQRKWESEVRQSKTYQGKTASWKGVKSKATKGINWAMNQTTNSNLDFLGRVAPTNTDPSDSDSSVDGGKTTKKTVPIDEMVLCYPTTFQLTNEEMRKEFVNTMLRTKSKAQRDTIIATGLMPVAYGIDILATLVWPFGGLGEIDTLWAWASFRGAKTARSVTKRLGSASNSENPHDNPEQDAQMQLNFVHSQRIEVLQKYLDAECHKLDPRLFPTFHVPPTETQVLEAIGWSPSHTGGADRNWEDEQWEISEVKEDVKTTFHKAAKEWRKWCLMFEKDPSKALIK